MYEHNQHIPWFSWILLSRQMKKEKNLAKWRIDPKLLCKRYDQGRAGLFLNGERRIVGYAALWETGKPSAVELGSFYVHPDERGRGIGTKVFKQCDAIIRENKLFGIMFSRGEAVKYIAEKFNWIESRDQIGDARKIAEFCGPGSEDFLRLICGWVKSEPAIVMRSQRKDIRPISPSLAIPCYDWRTEGRGYHLPY